MTGNPKTDDRYKFPTNYPFPTFFQVVAPPVPGAVFISVNLVIAFCFLYVAYYFVNLLINYSTIFLTIYFLCICLKHITS